MGSNAMKSNHDFMMSQQRWNSSVGVNQQDFSVGVNQGLCSWPGSIGPGPIQRPFNTIQNQGQMPGPYSNNPIQQSGQGPVSMPMASHYIPQNMTGNAPGGVKPNPNNPNNDSMNKGNDFPGNGTPPKSPHQISHQRKM